MSRSDRTSPRPHPAARPPRLRLLHHHHRTLPEQRATRERAPMSMRSGPLIAIDHEPCEDGTPGPHTFVASNRIHAVRTTSTPSSTPS